MESLLTTTGRPEVKLQVPSLSPSSSSWSWDHEEDRRRQEKWQEEQERLLQAQYQKDQERLESEWQRAQQDAKRESCRKSGVMLTGLLSLFQPAQHLLDLRLE
ncbi:LIM domain only protein 7 [Liparis tanakae]|uniref:LIM domain only protein 7 n=1 Tax=Liparis tanakae TaxID=230148 RepID=A0A4Z2HIQ9_9TELE|nr:LIM domain only protein 7 [Liparis tanakae]